MTPSPSFSLTLADLKEVGLGLLALVAATALSYLLSIVGSFNFGTYGPIVTIIAAPLLHLGIKWIKDNDTGLPGEEIIDSIPGRTS